MKRDQLRREREWRSHIVGMAGSRRLSWGGALFALVLSLSACTALVKAPSATAVANYKQSWNDLELSQMAHSTEDGYHRQLELIRSPLFLTLSPTEQHNRLLQAARAAYRYRDYSTGHRLARRLSEMPEADVTDWEMRVTTAYRAGDHLDTMRALTQVARLWPIDLQRLNTQAVGQIAQYTPKNTAEKDARFELLNSLYFAYWTVEGDVPPYELWGELAAELVERGQVDRALEIARKVDSPRFVLWMRIDKRFDALVRKDPDVFDIDRAAAREVADWIVATQRNNRKLEPIVQLTSTLLDVGRYQDALKITGAVLSKVHDAGNFKRLFDDDETELNWILDNNSRALEALQDWKDAEWAHRQASDRLESGRRNVSNMINLAGFEANLGRGNEALNLLADLPQDPAHMSAYGRMQLYGVRVKAAAEEGDSALEKQCLAYMQAHQTDAVATYEFALVQANRRDEAARLLIRRLKDPQMRRAALLDVQHYRNPPEPPEEQRMEQRWREIVDRKDVQKEIARVGRVLDVNLPP